MYNYDNKLEEVEINIKAYFINGKIDANFFDQLYKRYGLR